MWTLAAVPKNKNFHSEKYESEAREARLAGERGSWEKFLQFKINSCTGTDKTFWEERNCYFFKCANFKALRVGARMLSGWLRCCDSWLKAFNINQRCSTSFPFSTHPPRPSPHKRPKSSQRLVGSRRNESFPIDEHTHVMLLELLLIQSMTVGKIFAYAVGNFNYFISRAQSL